MPEQHGTHGVETILAIGADYRNSRWVSELMKRKGIVAE
jgi:hypothetical protein